MASNGGAKIILYTNHRCPWAHRAHIALSELKLPFEEVIIPLDRPRDPWYLKVNPRGLVPSLSYDGEIITESAVVAQFLADAHPSSHLLPASDAPGGALRRARVAFFVDAYMSKVHGVVTQFLSTRSDEQAEAVSQAAVAAVVKEVEPLLRDAKPFFGGSERITLAEVLTGSFIVRLLAIGEAGVYPESLMAGLKERAPSFCRWAEAVAAHPSVTNIFDAELAVGVAKSRLASARGQA